MELRTNEDDVRGSKEEKKEKEGREKRLFVEPGIHTLSVKNMTSFTSILHIPS